MSTPSDAPVPGTPPAIPPALAAPDQPVGADQELRSLVTQILQSSSLGFDPNTTRKGIVVSIETGSTPTLTVQLSGDTTASVAGVRYIDSYSPVAGDTVLIMKQGADLFAIGRIAISTAASVGWVQPTLAGGFSHVGNGIMYRKVWDNGSWKMQWKGQANRSSGTSVLSSALASDLRPGVDKLIAIAGEGLSIAKLTFTSSGTVTLLGSLSGHWHNIPSTGHSHSGTSSDAIHSHGGAVPNSNSHNHSLVSDGTHSHGHTDAPSVDEQDITAISLNSIEYFL
jgi:hypothetical protein